MPQRLCLAGKNRIAVEALAALNDAGLFDICVCPVQNDDGQDAWQPSLRKAANDRGITTVCLDEIYQEPGIVFLSVEFDKIIRTNRFSDALLLNLHFSLLPAYKGCFTSIWPLYFGEKQTGVTLHCIDDGIDTGDILDQRVIEIPNAMTARELYECYQDTGLALLKSNIQNIRSLDWPHKCKQPASGSTYYARDSLAKIGCAINMRATAEQIKNQVRSLFFPEYQTALWNGQKIARCEVTAHRSFKASGTVLMETNDTVQLATIDYDVVLYKYADSSR